MNARELLQTGIGWVSGDRSLRRLLAYGFAVRVLLLPFFSDSLNFYGYALATTTLQRGFNPYQYFFWEPMNSTLAPWGYPALYFVPSFLAILLSFGNGFLYGLWLRAPLVVADLLTSVAIFHIVQERSGSTGLARRIAALYLLNPFVILVSAIWGTNDSLAVLFAVLGTLFLVRTTKQTDLAALCFGWGTALKLFPVVLVLLALGTLGSWKARCRFVALAALPPVITGLPFLAAGPDAYLRTLYFYSISANQSTAFVWDSVWWLLSDTTGFLSPTAIIVSVFLYLGSVFVLAALVARGRVSFLAGATMSLLGIFLVAPRLVQNYFLWPMPFVFLSAALQTWPALWRRLALWTWLPALGTALIYNGRPEVTGLFYWLLISMGRLAEPITPSWIQFGYAFMIAFIALLSFSIGALARYAIHVDARSGSATRVSGLDPIDYPVRKGPDSVARAVVAASFGLFVVFGLLMAANHRPVLPEDFGSYTVTGTEITFTDDFHSTLLGYTWKYIGTTPYQIRPGGGLVLDTHGVNTSAAIRRAVPDGATNVSMTGTVEAVYGDFVQVARLPAGWVAVERDSNPSNPGYLLAYRDELTGTTARLGTVQLNTSFAWSAVITPTSTTLAYGSVGITMPGREPIAAVEFGATDVDPVAGGRLIIERVSLSFLNGSNSGSPLLLAGELVTTAVALGLTAEICRRAANNAAKNLLPRQSN